jgi:hypothetical protein
MNEVDAQPSSFFNGLIQRGQFDVIDRICDYLSDKDRMRLAITCKALYQLCVKEPWLAPGARRLACRDYGIDRQSWERWRVFSDLITPCALLAAGLSLLGSAFMTIHGLDTEIGWMQLWSRLRGAAERLPTGSWAKTWQLAKEFGGLGPLLIGLPPSGLLALIGGWLRGPILRADFWEKRLQCAKTSFAELDNQIDWTVVERRKVLTENVTAKAKFLHAWRQTLLQKEVDLGTGEAAYFHPLYRRYVELHYNVEFGRVQPLTPSELQRWQEAANEIKKEIEEKKIPPYWNRQPLVNRRMDCSQYGRDRFKYEEQIGVAHIVWDDPLAQISFHLGLFFALWAGGARYSGSILLHIFVALVNGLHRIGVSLHPVFVIISLGLLVVSSIGLPALTLIWLLDKMKGLPLLLLLKWRADLRIRALQLRARRPDGQFPGFYFKSDSFTKLDAAVDWQKVNTYGLMERNLLQMAAAWSVELEEARKQGLSERELKATADRINQEFAHARSLMVVG